MNYQAAELSSLIQDDAPLRAEARQRKEQFDYTSIHPEDEEKYSAKGWALHASGVNKVKLRRPKTHHALLEDRVWLLLHKLGYRYENNNPHGHR